MSLNLPTLLYCLRSSILTDLNELDQRVILIRQSGSGARVFVRVLKLADALNTN